MSRRADYNRASKDLMRILSQFWLHYTIYTHNLQERIEKTFSAHADFSIDTPKRFTKFTF